ncbi:hypothetical protein BCR12_04380 [Limnothrix sp. P13C2]|nr:hypothetical protein BCR12_04380 [Limnothrix sp. P13C2]
MDEFTALNAPQSEQFERVRSSLRRAIEQLGTRDSQRWNALIQPDLDRLAGALDKLDRFVVRIAAFGLVSRGKSAVLNALLGERLLETGPLNGLTRLPRSVRWHPPGRDRPIEVEFIDTPGLDEIDGESRAELSREVAERSDLILFITAGDLTQVEYAALRTLRQAHKPLILVFNKIDLFPETERPAIVERLRSLMQLEAAGQPPPTHPPSNPAERRWDPFLPVDEIVLAAAEPAPIQVREEWPDGRVTYGWESPPPEIETLRSAILATIDREGEALLALNALMQARTAQQTIAQKTLTHLRDDAEAQTWRFIQVKAVIVALSPFVLLDAIAAVLVDWFLVRSLSRLYGLPLVRSAWQSFWKTGLVSLGAMLLGEVGGGFLGGNDGRSLQAGSDGFSGYLGAALVQAAAAAFGSLAIAKTTRSSLEAGCTWGDDGPDTLAKDLLDFVEPGTVLHQLRDEWRSRIGLGGLDAKPTDPAKTVAIVPAPKIPPADKSDK